jgi:hypothetical protein
MDLEVAGLTEEQANDALIAWSARLGCRVAENDGFLNLRDTGAAWRVHIESCQRTNAHRLCMASCYQIRPAALGQHEWDKLLNKLNRLEGHCQFSTTPNQLLVAKFSFLFLRRLQPYQFFGYVATADALMQHVYTNPLYRDTLREGLM